MVGKIDHHVLAHQDFFFLNVLTQKYFIFQFVAHLNNNLMRTTQREEYINQGKWTLLYFSSIDSSGSSLNLQSCLYSSPCPPGWILQFLLINYPNPHHQLGLLLSPEMWLIPLAVLLQVLGLSPDWYHHLFLPFWPWVQLKMLARSLQDKLHGKVVT